MKINKYHPGDDVREILVEGIRPDLVQNKPVKTAMQISVEAERNFNQRFGPQSKLDKKLRGLTFLGHEIDRFGIGGCKPHLTWAEYQRCLSMDEYDVLVFLACKRRES